MTTQEFVKQEVEAASNQMFPIGNEHESKMIARQEYRSGMAYGLTKGLEITKEFAEWTQRNRYKQKGGKKGKGEWYVQSAGYGGGEPEIYTTSELLTIFLTEKYGNNG